MATLEWGDTFGHYVKDSVTAFSASPMSKKWTTQLGEDNSDRWVVGPAYGLPGAPGSCGAYVQAPNNKHALKTLPLGSQATRCISVWWNPGTQNTNTNGPIIAFYDSGAEQCSVRLDGAGHIVVSRNGTTLATSPGTISANTWYHIQFKATINNSTGAYEVRVNGTATGWIGAATGANTRGTGSNNSANQACMGNVATGWRFTNYVVTDDFPGVVQGAYLHGAAAGNYQQWTPNSGDNRGAVSWTLTDDDASFVSSTTSGNKDTFVMDDVPSPGTPAILGIQHVIYAKQDAGVQRTIRPKTRIGSTDYNGTSVNTGASYTFYTEAVSVSPATSSAWTKAEIDGAEFGYENV